MSNAIQTPFDSQLCRNIEAMTDCLASWQPDLDRRAFHARVDAIVEEAHLVCRRAPTRSLGDEWRSSLHRHFLEAPFIARAFSKPLGYAGDYELMNIIYRNRPEGETPIGRALHQWANSFRSACAVRSRRRWVLQQMQDHARQRDGAYRVLSLASGPAMELQDLVRESFLAERAELLCIDQDAQSLATARAEIERAMRETGRYLPASFSSDSVKRLLLRGGESQGYGPRDFIYTMGLYDYLPEEVGRKLAALLYKMLAPGGRLVIGNFGRQADAQAFLDLVCDWHLIYRSADEVRNLAADMPADARVDVTLDATGTVYFLVVDKP